MPSSNSELIILHAWEDSPVYLKCIQGESGIKIAKFQLVDDNGAINLTGNTGVTFMGVSGNGSAVSVNCTVDTAAEGKISLNASTNFTNAIGNTKGNIVVSFSSGNIQFDGITIKVRPNPAIEALIQDDTFATFLNALSRLQNISSGTVTEVDSALSTSSTHPVQNSAITTAINQIISDIEDNSGDINNIETAIENLQTTKVGKDFFSTVSFMCDANGQIFTVTNDTEITNQSFDNQNLTTQPYFIWIAHNVTSVANNAFVNTNKISKIYCEHKSSDTPLPNNYQSLPVEYGYSSLFSFYLITSLIGLLNNKANTSDVYDSNTADNTFEKNSNKSDDFSFDLQTTTNEHNLFPTVARIKDFLNEVFVTKDNLETDLGEIQESLNDKAEVDDLDAKLNDNDNVIETNHIKNGVVTLDKLAADVIPEIYIGTTDKSSTENGTSTQVYKKHDRYINKNNGKIWVCTLAQLSSSVWQYTWSLKGSLYILPATKQYTIPASSWSNNVQGLTLSNYTVTSNTKVDIEINDEVINQLSIDDCRGIYVANNNGVLTINALDNSPTSNITVQLVIYEINDIN